jgi:hypothetical protein
MRLAMQDRGTAEERELLRRWVETWIRAGVELEALRRREIESADTQQAVRQLFDSAASFPDLAPRVTSGLVEQQAWFAKLRAKQSPR